THAVAEAVAQAGVPVLLSASAIGFYGGSRGSGQNGDQILDETASVGTGFLADVVRQWEAATAPADRNARVVHLRTGIVQSREGGALATQLPLFKAGLGAPLGSGRQWVSWISLQDEVAAIVHLLSADVSGPVNLVGPEPVTNRAYTQALGKALHRPTLPVGVPAPVLRIALGEFAGEVLGGQRLVPRVLVGSGFAFAHEDLASALRAALR
ncbi:MAG: epimerase, partial [Frankiales bacterium]|nr:epimerase [Frankiales bacterium]